MDSDDPRDEAITSARSLRHIKEHLATVTSAENEQSQQHSTKSQLGCLTIIIVIAVFTTWVYVKHKRTEANETRRIESENATRKLAVQRSILTLGHEYDAVADWRSSLRTRGLTDPIFSGELTPVLVRQQPILLMTYVRDVAQKEGQCLATLEGKINLRSNLRLNLACDAEQETMMMQSPRGKDSRFAIVTKISSVDGCSEEFVTDDDEQRYSQQVCVASGTLLGLLRLGNYRDDYVEILNTYTH